MDFIQARWLYKGRLRPIRLAVIHTLQSPEAGDTAERNARYFATTDRKVSAHRVRDNNSAVNCVREEDTAFAAPGCNADGLQLELAGYAQQSVIEWGDAYSKAVLVGAAQDVAEWCKRWNIPPRRLTNDQLRAGERGIISHYQASQVYGGSHWDPGPNFPWHSFIQEVQRLVSGTPTQPPAEPIDLKEETMKKLWRQAPLDDQGNGYDDVFEVREEQFVAAFPNSGLSPDGKYGAKPARLAGGDKDGHLRIEIRDGPPKGRIDYFVVYAELA